MTSSQISSNTSTRDLQQIKPTASQRAQASLVFIVSTVVSPAIGYALHGSYRSSDIGPVTIIWLVILGTPAWAILYFLTGLFRSQRQMKLFLISGGSVVFLAGVVWGLLNS